MSQPNSMSNVKGHVSIVVVGPQGPDTLPKSVLLTLRKMGYDAEPVDEREMLGFSYKADMEKNGRVGLLTKVRDRLHDMRMKSSSSYERRTQDRLASLIEAKKPDLVIAFSAWFSPAMIARVKKNTGAKIAFWFPDHPGNVGRQYFYAAPYDALFFKDQYLVRRAEALGKNAYYLPEACMPEWHRAVERTDEDRKRYACDITTAGNLYYYRALVFERLMEKGYSIKLWGDVPRWLDSPARKCYEGRNVTELEKSKAFRAAKIVINTFQGEVEGVNQRFFEIAGCGGFQLCEHRDEVGKFLEIGKEVVTFTDLGDLVQKIDYYLAHDDERKKIAERAEARAAREHTFEHRLKAMLETIDL